VPELERQLTEPQGAVDDAGADPLRLKSLRRMWNLARMMQELKQRFSLGTSARNGRPGPRREGRFKRVLLEGMGRTLSTMAASIGLNPVRAGIGKDPGDYRRRGYAEAVAGWKLAGPGLSRVVMGVLPSERSGETAREQMRRLLARYRTALVVPAGCPTELGTGLYFASEPPTRRSSGRKWPRAHGFGSGAGCGQAGHLGRKARVLVGGEGKDRIFARLSKCYCNLAKYSICFRNDGASQRSRRGGRLVTAHPSSPGHQ
jgi:hypothetical protein